MARGNGLSIVTFPPHCSHRMQPLDVCVYGPAIQTLFQCSMLSHPAKTILIYDVAELSEQAFGKAFSILNITSRLHGFFT